MISKSFLYGLYLASVNSFALVLLKTKYIGYINGSWILPLVAIIYATQPLVFYTAFFHNISLTTLNLIWDLFSDIIISFIGLVIFKEQLLFRQYIGLIFSFIALILLR